MNEPPTVKRWAQYAGGSLTGLLDWARQHGIHPDDLTVTDGRLRWETRETPEETERRVAFERQRDARHEAWERETWERLQAKFGSTPNGGPAS